MRPFTAELPDRGASRGRQSTTTALTIAMVMGVLVAIPGIALSVASQPWILLFNLKSLVVVIPVLLWLDSVEPKPWSSRLTALAWGAGIAAVLAGAINTASALWVNDAFSIVVSAPASEE